MLWFSRAPLRALLIATTAVFAVGAQAADVKADAKAEVKGDAKPKTKTTPDGRYELDEAGMYVLPKSARKPILDQSSLTAEQKALLGRVQGRWAAMVAFDLPKVYSYATPAYRKTHDQLHLNGQYAAQISREKVEVFELNIGKDDPNTAKVLSKLHFQSMPMAGMGPMPMQNWQKETWVKVDGQWWFVEPK